MDPKVEVAINLASQTLTLPDGRKIEFAVDTFSKTSMLTASTNSATC